MSEKDDPIRREDPWFQAFAAGMFLFTALLALAVIVEAPELASRTIENACAEVITDLRAELPH